MVIPGSRITGVLVFNYGNYGDYGNFGNLLLTR
jgi:hypothetical protein